MLVNILGIKRFILGLASKIKPYKECPLADDKTPTENENASENGSNEATECFEYVIYPQKIINITQIIKLSNYRITNEFTLSNDNTYVNHKRIVYGL